MGFLRQPSTIAVLSGAFAVLGYAPFGLFPLPVLSLSVLFWLWGRTERPAQAAWLGFAFGMGLFCAGVGWIYVALHDYGYMHPLLAALATAGFAAVNAALPAFAGYVQARLHPFVVITSDLSASGLSRMAMSNHEGSPFDRLMKLLAIRLGWPTTPAKSLVIRANGFFIVMPAAWTLAEWLRGLLFTGFPWLSVGYSQVPASPLAGYAPLLGVYGVSLAVAVSAGLLAMIWQARWGRTGKLAVVALILIWGMGALLRSIEWTEPIGEPLSVALVQGNIPQDLKFDQDALVGTLETYRRLALQQEARLTVLPETALPLLRNEAPSFMVEQLRDHARKNGGDMIAGAFVRNNGSYYNSVFTLGSAPEQYYHKNHLVPFGEFIPLRPLIGWFVNGVLDIPMGDLGRGDARQPPLEVAGQKVAANICYEDAFGEEIIRALPEATLLVNVTNDAWYGESHAAAQHNQLSQMRALETGRMVLRATNTGATSIIAVDGSVLAELPQHEEGVLTGTVQGYAGSTPYVRWGNAAVLILAAAMLAFAWSRHGK